MSTRKRPKGWKPQATHRRQAERRAERDRARKHMRRELAGATGEALAMLRDPNAIGTKDGHVIYRDGSRRPLPTRAGQA